MALFNDLTVPDDEIVADIQGNILRGYVRTRTFLCFLRFDDDVPSNRRWIDAHVLDVRAPFPITTARQQNDDPETPLINFMLTSTGLEKLGCAAEQLERMDRSFTDGVRNEQVRSKLGDTAPAAWAPEYRDSWDALLLVACRAAESALIRRQLAEIGAGVSACMIEEGNGLDARGAPVDDADRDGGRFEAFGFKDGISHLLFSDEHVQQRLNAGRIMQNAEGGVPWPSTRPLSVVLRNDPLSPKSFGSYFVYRKLVQNVPEFRARVRAVAQRLLERNERTGQRRGAFLHELYGRDAQSPFAIFELDEPPIDGVERLVKSRMMGRAPNGEALVPGNTNPAPDGFDFSDDRDGRICPFYAHIRKMNPRGATGDPEREQRRSLVRRGMPYGRADERAGGGECGLLFLCAQSNIAEQFEFHQANWANAGAASRPVDFGAEPTPAPDNISAQPAPVADQLDYKDELDRYKRYTRTIDVDVRAYDLVTLRGSEYLFAPSLSGLRALVNGGRS